MLSESPNSEARKGATDGSRPVLRIGVVGTGCIGQEHLRNIFCLMSKQQHPQRAATETHNTKSLRGRVVPKVELSAVADPHSPSRDAAMEIVESSRGDFPQLHVAQFSTHAELFEECRTEHLCNCLIICTPNFNHITVVKDALATTECNILVEKPLCTTVEDCRAVELWLQEDRRCGRQRVFWVGMEYRFIPPIEKLISSGDSGTLGNLKMLSIREHRFPFLAKVGHWNRLNELSGGTLVEKCCHFFDLMRRILKSNPVKVIASGGQNVCYKEEQYVQQRGSEAAYLNVVDSSAEEDEQNITHSDILDNAFVIVEFANGSRAMLDLCMFAETSFNQDEISLIGDRGKAESFGMSHGSTEEDASRVNFRLGQRPHHGQWNWQKETRPPPSQELPEIEQRHVGVGDRALLQAGAHEGSTYFELEHWLCEIERVRGGGMPGGRGGEDGGSLELVSARDGTWAVAMGVAAQKSIEEGGRPVRMSEVVSWSGGGVRGREGGGREAEAGKAREVEAEEREQVAQVDFGG